MLESVDFKGKPLSIHTNELMTELLKKMPNLTFDYETEGYRTGREHSSGIYHKLNVYDGRMMIGEIGGDAEERAAAFIREYVTKPVVGYVAGFTAPEGKTMGHAGAIISAFGDTAAEKAEIMRSLGLTVAKSPAHLGEAVAYALATKPPRKKYVSI